MERKVNYDQRMQRLIASLPASDKKPRLLLHVCCAPCSTAVLERLAEHFEVILYFDNPNLDSLSEHDLRAMEALRLGEESGWASQVNITPYRPKTWFSAVNGLESEPEGGKRCAVCFNLRLQNSAKAARELACDWFTTTLTISPMKDAALLNELGRLAGEEAGILFLPSDFKKRGGYQRSIALSREHDLYRQDYCGCVFSKRARQEAPDTQ